MKKQITCPACKMPWINTDGKWNICVDCPYRDAGEVHDIDAKIVSADDTIVDRDNADGDDIFISVNLTALMRYIAELELKVRELTKANAEHLFRMPDDSG
jgi:uncharacterized Zn finger protein (UPF0148 family)